MTELFGRVTSARPPSADDAAEVEIDAGGMRWLRRQLPGAVVALTTVVDEVYRATTLTGVLVASVDPPQMLVSIEIDSQMEGWLQQSGVFGLSFLGWKQQFLADQFAGFTPLASASFRGIEHFTATTGSPLLSHALAWADCTVAESFPTGDHRCFLGDIVELGRGGSRDEPLIYYRGRYRRMHELKDH